MARIQPSSENYSSDTAYWAARDMFDDILFQINAVTDAETEYIPIVHGHWKSFVYNRPPFKCSRCRNERDWGAPFCEWCGAKMDESEDNTNV